MTPQANLNWLMIYPEIIICLTAGLVLIVDLLLPKKQKWWLGVISFVGVVVALQFVFKNFWLEGSSFYGMVKSDAIASYFKIIFPSCPAIHSL